MDDRSQADTRILRDRAVVHLRGRLRSERRRVARGFGAPDDPVERAGLEGTLLALESVGALSAEEVSHWRRRLHAAATVPEPANEYREGVVARALEHLETLVAPVSPSNRDGATACFSVVRTYENTGILSAGAALAWRERLRAQLDLEPERPPRCSRLELLRVVVGPPQRGGGLRITHVELYADGVVLHWHHAREFPRGSSVPRVWTDRDIETAGAHDEEPRVLTDDLGTRYLGAGGPDLGIDGGGWAVLFGTASFTPAVPSAARRLRVPYHGGDFDIEL